MYLNQKQRIKSPKYFFQVQMKAKVESLPNKLHTIVSTDKPIFSSPQIQLLCLARALLRGTKVLVVEEIQTCYDARYVDSN
jgi:ABC-type multidrug transport system fused ATPase/permease subunit